MNIIIIDDLATKAHWSEREIKYSYPKANIMHFFYGEDAIKELEKERKNEENFLHIDFIVLDMHFTYSRAKGDDRLACLDFLEEMYNNPFVNEKTPVCICSSGGWVSQLDKYDNVVTFLRYGNDNADEIYRDLLKRFD